MSKNKLNLYFLKSIFQKSASLEYIYFGSNIGVTSIPSGACWFDETNSLKTVILMDITYIGKWNFSLPDTMPRANKLTVYCHSSSISIENEAFNTKKGGEEIHFYTRVLDLAGIGGNCNYVIYRGIPHAYMAQDSEATCTTAGTTGYSIDCPCGALDNGKSYTVVAYSSYAGDTAGGTITIGSTTPALGHQFKEEEQYIVSQTDAFCGKNATITYKCTRCDEAKTIEQEGTAQEHQLNEWVIVVPVTCLTDGTRQQICALCNAVVNAEKISATGHDIDGVEWTKSSDATCTVGQINIKACKTCGATIETQTLEPNGHTDGEWKIVFDADCITDGERELYCSVCNAMIKIEKITALGHEFDTTKGATLIAIVYELGFDKDGATTTRCARCDETSDGVIEAIFEALGYSVGPDGYSVKMGFLVSTNELEVYKTLYPTFEFGMLFINANSVATTESFFNGSALNATAKGIKVEVEGLKYVTINADLRGFNASNAGALELVMGIYTIDKDGKTSVIQYVDATNYATNKTYADLTLNVVNFNQVRLAHGLEALVPVVTTGDDE